MRRIVLFLLLLPLLAGAREKVLEGVVVNADGEGLPYPAVRTQSGREGVLGDSVGRFSLPVTRVLAGDSVVVSYIGYEAFKIALTDIDTLQSDTIVLPQKSLTLAEVCVLPAKIKKKVKGKKHSWAMLKTMIGDPIAGESFGYEFHARERRQLLLYKVGFFYCDGDNQMSRMKFRLNVYDMAGVKGDFSSDFVPVLPEPVYFDFILPEGEGSGKFEYVLPESVVLPADAMVEIEFVESLDGEIFWFKSNLFGKTNWTKVVGEGVWCKTPFAGPFFVECVEMEQ